MKQWSNVLFQGNAEFSDFMLRTHSSSFNDPAMYCYKNNFNAIRAAFNRTSDSFTSILSCLAIC